ncbi:MAG TPA: site-2 protease family protein [Gammaproteobacteria bacterium]|nr:site-2 protease family protein [Gammaproteobacteria bacterium]
MDDLALQMQRLAIWVLPVLFAITLHEVAHGWAAERLGDKTARRLGRISLNPIRHIDPVGTVLVPLLLFFTSGFIFGWAKPVPVTWENLRRPKRDMALVAVAGPGANLLMAIGWALLAKLAAGAASLSPTMAQGLVLMGLAGLQINIVLMVLNLLPLPPLDGSRIVSGVLPPGPERAYAQIEPYGIVILLLLMVTGVLGKLLIPPVLAIMRAIGHVLGIA